MPDGCDSLCVVRCLLSVVYCVWCVVCHGSLFVVRCRCGLALCVVCCMLFVSGRCSLLVVCCLLSSALICVAVR